MNKKKVKQNFVLQNDQSDCGVACLLSLIKFYSGFNTLERLRELSGTSKQGTTLLGLYQAANQVGFDAEGFEADLDSLIKHNKPVIIHVRTATGFEHFMVCYGFEDECFIIGDPASGIESYSKDDLQKIWISKACLTLNPNSHFIEINSIKQTKRDWIARLVKEDIKLLGLSVLLGLAISILSLAMAVFSQKLIDDIIPSNNLKKLFIGIGLLTILLFFRAGLMAIREFFLITQGKNFNNRIIRYFYGSLLFLPKPFFDTRRIGELVARLNDTTRIQRVITEIAGNVIIDTLLVIISLIFIFIYTWEAGIISIIAFPLYFLLVFHYNRLIITSHRRIMGAYAHSESNYISSMEGIATIKTLNKQDYFQKINQIIYGNFQKSVFDLGKINIRLGFISGMGGVIILISILSYSSFMVIDGQLKLGELMAVIGIASSMIPSMISLALVAIPINEAKVAFNRMFEFVNIKPELNEKTDAPIPFESLEIKNLSFRFPGRKQILKKIDLVIKKNELIAIVGESGCGKTTLCQILAKFYSPEDGDIIVNKSVNFNSINPNDWRAILGIVPQEIHLFNGNVSENISLGKESENSDEVVRFCEEYGFHSFFNSFPQGYSTMLGEEGINLSGGQIQLIGLARALYAKPKLLILDEATAAMDRNTENFVLQLLNQLKTRISIIIISHRLHKLKKLSDRIYIIEDGIIKASGNHDQLMKSQNLYSEFWNDIAYTEN